MRAKRAAVGMHEPESFLTADELARLLRVGREWVYDRAVARDLPSYKLPGGQRRFLYSQVRDAMEQWRSDAGTSGRLGV